MSFPNSNYSDIIATTIESRSRSIADNVTKNNALLSRLKKRGKIKTFSGGRKIIQELSFAENGNAGWYAGYDVLPVAASDVISAAEFEIKQLAVPVVISGLEQLQNAGKEQMIDLMEGRLEVAESTMANYISAGLYSDASAGIGGAKSIDGLGAALTAGTSNGRISTGSYGGITRASTGITTFWRQYYAECVGTANTTPTYANLKEAMNLCWSNLVRGMDRPDLIITDNILWTAYIGGLQDIQRFTSTDQAGLGFPSLKFMDADVVLDGGIGGYAGDAENDGSPITGGTMYFLNTNYIHYRPHAQRNMVPLSPNKRYAVNQDAEVQILAWAGNMTCSGLQFQGRVGNAAT
jgi:hypothetical protein